MPLDAEASPAQQSEASTLEVASPPSDAKPSSAARAEATSFGTWLSGSPLGASVHLVLGLVLPAIVLVTNMWRVRRFTIDDAYISFRYARNFANGNGLVYNLGERIEGYTNFLFTVVLAGAIKVGLAPNVVAKLLGGGAALGALAVTYLLARRMRPLDGTPVVATWLLASTIVFSGYAVFGLETSTFVFLVLAGTELVFRETTRADRGERGPLGDVPLSGVVFGLAGLTRPEAPMFIGLVMLFLGRRMFAPKNILRGVLFVLPIAAHMAFRKSYYGTWLPNTLSAKTGALDAQMHAGASYLQNYAAHAGPILWIALFGAAIGIADRSRITLVSSAIAAAVLGYVVLVGGDWMPFFRFVAPFEPFCFLLIDLAVRTALDRRDRGALIGFAMLTPLVAYQRTTALDEAQKSILQKEDRFWTMAAGGTAKWFVEHGKPGQIAIGDIGYIGWVTDYPILDLLGLVDPVISKLPGGYTHKLGPGFLDHFFAKRPDYFLLISSNVDCEHPSVPGSQVVYRDPRFKPNYAVAGKVPLDGGFAWCIYQRKN